MLDWIYDWIKNLCFYMILVSAFLKALPGKTYEKYIRFFSGVILILLLTTPVLKLGGMEETVSELYHNNEYLQEKSEIEMMEKYFEEADLLDFLPEEYGNEKTDDSQQEIEIAPIEVENQ